MCQFTRIYFSTYVLWGECYKNGNKIRGSTDNIILGCKRLFEGSFDLEFYVSKEGESILNICKVCQQRFWILMLIDFYGLNNYKF